MPRELRASVSVVLPEDTFDEAEALMALRPIITKLKADLTELSQTNTLVGVKVTVEVVRPRGEKDPAGGGA